MWPDNDTFCERVVIFINDVTPYTVKALISLKVFYSNLISVIYLAHVIPQVAEQIAENYKPVNKIIFCVNKTFLKTPMRVKIYIEM